MFHSPFLRQAFLASFTIDCKWQRMSRVLKYHCTFLFIPWQHIYFWLVDRFGVPIKELPEPAVEWEAFTTRISALNDQTPAVWNPARKRMTKWIDMKALNQSYKMGQKGLLCLIQICFLHWSLTSHYVLLEVSQYCTWRTLYWICCSRLIVHGAFNSWLGWEAICMMS